MLRSGVNSKIIKTAAEKIRGGGLVIFPTETVYGIGADAFNADAVRRIYSEKGRPSDNPLILHIAGDAREKFRELTHNPPEYAFSLIEAFWPGPLTLVAKKNPALPAWLGTHPDGATATLGIRMPAHPIARALIEAAGRPIAAPSANISGRPSPTAHAHVIEDFPAREEILTIDGGNSVVGLESTVVDVTGEAPVILRPGTITGEMIFEKSKITASAEKSSESTPRSPGMKYKHYAPMAQMTIISGEASNIAAWILKEVEANPQKHAGILLRDETRRLFPSPAPSNVKILTLGGDETEIAQNLFARLREFDTLGVDIIFAEGVSENGIGAAIMDRMKKAAGGAVLHV